MSKPVSVQMTITRCSECPHRKVGPSYSLDGFDRGNDWTCLKADKMIAEFVEWSDKETAGVPTWCPLRKKGR